MNTHAENEKENKSESFVNKTTQSEGAAEATFQLVDSRPKAIQMQQLQELADNSSRVKGIAQLQAMADSFTTQEPPIQRQENKTGLPDDLKSGMENLTGHSLNDVKVHRNSDQPAQLNAHAYAQGTDIHLGPGQEKHLPHELGHVVQQKEGRVKPTKQLKEKTNVNDDPALEKEADVLGVKALNKDLSVQKKGTKTATSSNTNTVSQLMINDLETISEGSAFSLVSTKTQKIQSKIKKYYDLCNKGEKALVKIDLLNEVSALIAAWNNKHTNMLSDDDHHLKIAEELNTIENQISVEQIKLKLEQKTEQIEEQAYQGLDDFGTENDDDTIALLGAENDNSESFSMSSSVDSSAVFKTISEINEKKISLGFSAIAEAQGKFDFEGSTKNADFQASVEGRAKGWAEGLLEIQKLDGALGLLAEIKVGLNVTSDAQGQAKARFKELEASIEGKLSSIATLGADLSVSAEVGKNGFKINGAAAVVAAVSAKASLAGKLTFKGQELLSGEASAEAMAGANAAVKGKIEITKDGISLEGEAGAFAGLSAKASANISLLEDHLKVGATASIQLGVGAKLSGKFEIKNNKLTISGEIAAALGIGGALGINIEIYLGDGLQKAWDYIVEKICSGTFNHLKQLAERPVAEDKQPLLG